MRDRPRCTFECKGAGPRCDVEPNTVSVNRTQRQKKPLCVTSPSSDLLDPRSRDGCACHRDADCSRPRLGAVADRSLVLDSMGGGEDAVHSTPGPAAVPALGGSI